MVRAANGHQSTNCTINSERLVGERLWDCCIARHCAMWRWGTTGNHEHDCAVTGTPLTQKPPRAGYCGLAGKSGT